MKKGLKSIADIAIRTYSGMSTTWRAISASLVMMTLIGLIALFFIPSESEPRARQYTDFKSCLLTDHKGISEKPASLVWDGMQHASLKTLSKVQYLTNTEVKSTNAFPYIGTLIQTHCNLIIAVGKSQTAAVESTARSHPRVRFVVVGATVHSPNVTSIGADPGDLPNRISEIIIAADD